MIAQNELTNTARVPSYTNPAPTVLTANLMHPTTRTSLHVNADSWTPRGMKMELKLNKHTWGKDCAQWGKAMWTKGFASS